MDADAKKTALRMIPYGIYVLTADDGQGNVAGATVNWVTQTAFAPPLVVAAVKTDSGAYKVVKAAQAFALNMLGIHGYNGLPIVEFNKPEQYWDGSETLTYSYRLAASYRPRVKYDRDLRALDGKALVLVGADDEAIDAEALRLLFAASGSRAGHGVAGH